MSIKVLICIRKINFFIEPHPNVLIDYIYIQIEIFFDGSTKGFIDMMERKDGRYNSQGQ